MLRKTMIVLARAAALTSELTVEAFAHIRGDMTEQGCKLMATLGVVVNSLGNLEAVLPAASALAKRHVDYCVEANDYNPVGTTPPLAQAQELRLRSPHPSS